MAIPVLLIGKSGTGKSTSMKDKTCRLNEKEMVRSVTIVKNPKLSYPPFHILRLASEFPPETKPLKPITIGGEYDPFKERCKNE